ncbi:MAG: 50S ribosomal protein L30 [Candidatus Azosocius agrarius]|nr:MAG: 50S ribosomal protein L30 [Gammaproteobacteria bacterium]
MLYIKLLHSSIGRIKSHKFTLLGLGLKKIGQSVCLEDNCYTRGMINKVCYLLEVKE